jgi:hypothetical protein
MRVRPSPPLRPSTLLLALALAGPVLLPSPVQAQSTATASPVVNSLEVNADAGLAPGSILDFMVRGTPQGQARVQLEGSGVTVPLREDTPGLYTGRHTVARDDRIDPRQPIQATLRANGRMVISRFDFPASFVAFRDRRQRDVEAPVAAAAPRAGMTGPDPILAPTSTLGAAPVTVAVPLSLEVLSPAVGTAVDSSQVLVQGRATPNALVHAQVHAIPLAPAGRAAVALPVSEQTVQADANGNFSFGLGAQRVPAGARLELELEALRGSEATPRQRFVLYQRQG